MDELRVVRREDGSLILANELGEEYRLAIDESVAQEVRLALPRAASAVRVRPREIQALLRAGKSRAEVAVETGLEEADVERFEEPVRAEKRYMLDLAHAVVVRTDPAGTGSSPSANDDEQRFGQVIAERLVGLGNVNSEWRSWRDEEAGWLIGLAFDSRDGDHDAVWSFDHKKRVLSPLTPDATNLSKVGEIGDRLIPKLRAVDAEESERETRPEPAPFDPDGLLAPTQEVEPLPAAGAAAGSDVAASATASDEPVNADAEYERRREIDHLAVKTTEDDVHDLSQTADLLDALRRRRGERSREAAESLPEPDGKAAGDESGEASPLEVLGLPPRAPNTRRGAAANIWGTAGVSGVSTDEDPSPATSARDGRSGGDQGMSDGDGADTAQLRAVPAAPGADLAPDAGEGSEAGADSSASDATEAPQPQGQRGGQAGGREGRSSKRGRSSIPSWDDILFGTRSDDDPA